MKNIRYTGQVLFSNGESLTRLFVTEEAFINWADRMYKKDNNCTVLQFEAFTDNVICAWHA